MILLYQQYFYMPIMRMAKVVEVQEKKHLDVGVGVGVVEDTIKEGVGAGVKQISVI
jgi:hypothetical protein